MPCPAMRLSHRNVEHPPVPVRSDSLRLTTFYDTCLCCLLVAIFVRLTHGIGLQHATFNSSWDIYASQSFCGKADVVRDLEQRYCLFSFQNCFHSWFLVWHAVESSASMPTLSMVSLPNIMNFLHRLIHIDYKIAQIIEKFDSI
jgi:hypothetical protein